MIEINKDHIGKEVLLQATGAPCSVIMCNKVERISPNGAYALLISKDKELFKDIGWVKISTHWVLDVLE